MFRHEDNVGDLVEDIIEIEEDDIDEGDVEDLNDEKDEKYENINESTFVNPSQFTDEDINETVEESLKITMDEVLNDSVKEAIGERMIECENFKCDLCIFQTTDKRRFDRHTFENHSVKGKYNCIQCLQTFDKRKHFNISTTKDVTHLTNHNMGNNEN